MSWLISFAWASYSCKEQKRHFQNEKLLQYLHYDTQVPIYMLKFGKEKQSYFKSLFIVLEEQRQSSEVEVLPNSSLVHFWGYNKRIKLQNKNTLTSMLVTKWKQIYHRKILK